MLPGSRFIIFSPPRSPSDWSPRTTPARRFYFQCGTFNKKLVSDIALFNGSSPGPRQDFSLFWGTPQETEDVTAKSHLQKINHFPNSKWILGDKSALAEILQSHPAIRSLPHFFPTSYVFPRDREMLFRVMKSRPRSLFIAKPPGGSCGNGIKLVSYTDFYSIPPGSVVSEYISRPLCIDNFKCDLRIYVLVTSFAPLRAYLAKEGLARFATESYSMANGSPYSHLTNATLNKRSRNWSNGAFKWRLSELLTEVEHRWRHPRGELMNRVTEIVRFTLALVQPSMAPRERRLLTEPYFEIYGLDILIDRDFEPHLLEINTMPSLNTAEDVDFDVKAPMIAQALSIVGIADMPVHELLAAEAGFRLPPGGLDEFDMAVALQEADRNQLSGEGFIQVFPTDSEVLNVLLVRPPVNIEKYALKVKGKSSDASGMLEEDLMAFLYHFLCGIEVRIRTSPADPKLLSRVHCFLVAQGYKVAKTVVGLRVLLKSFLERIRGWASGAAVERMKPGDGQSYEDDAVKRILANASLCYVRNPGLLFG
jgi:tubulin polyglutamylase TTLL5